jgi:hypothetical protein
VVEWHIERDWAAGPSPGTHREWAWAFSLERNDENCQVTVEFVAGHGGGSRSEALEALRPHLDDDQPPRRLVVDRDGRVHPHNE